MCKKKIAYTCTRVWTFTNSPRYCVICLLYEKSDVQHLYISDGIKFYISENDVVLTEGRNGFILPKYFKKAYKISSSKHLCIYVFGFQFYKFYSFCLAFLYPWFLR